MDKVEVGASTALVGAGIFTIHSHYRDHAGSLSDCRNASPDDPHARQRVLDADVLTGGLVVLVGGSLSYLTKSPLPLALAVAGFVLIAGYYHGALNGPALALPHPTPDTEKDNGNDLSGDE